MKTKKLIAGLVSVITLASAATSVIASAADFKVSISDATAAPGEKFTLKMDLTDIPSTGLNGCEFGISYDSSLVKINKVELGDLARDVSGVEADLPTPLECNIESDVISLMYAIGTTDSSYFMTGSGTFLNITGTVKDGASGKAVFSVVPVDRAVAPGSASTNNEIVFGYLGADETIQTYKPTFVDGTLTITGTTPTQATDPTTQPTTGATDPITQPTTGATDPTTQPTSGNKPTDPTTQSTAATTTGGTPTTNNVEIPKGSNYGDVNLDGAVNIADVVAINKYLLNGEENPLAPDGIANADCQRDNVIDAADSTLIMNYVAMSIGIEDLGA